MMSTCLFMFPKAVALDISDAIEQGYILTLINKIGYNKSTRRVQTSAKCGSR